MYKDDRGHDDADRTEKKNKKKKAKKARKALGAVSKSSNLLDRYNGLETKSNVNNSLIKTFVDLAAGTLVGPALSAALGKYAPVAGAALSFGGHYLDDQSGLLRGIGMGTIAHSVAKTKEYRDPNSTMSDRFLDLKDNWLRMIFIKKDSEVNGFESGVEIEPLINPENLPDLDNSKAEQMKFEVHERELDLSVLDQYQKQLEDSANTYKDIHGMPDWTEGDEDEEPDGFFSRHNDPELPDDFDFNLM